MNRQTDNGINQRRSAPVRRPPRAAQIAAKKKKRRVKIICLLIVIALAAYGIALIAHRTGNISFPSAASAASYKKNTALEELEGYPVFADEAGAISSRCALMVDISTGRVICEKNSAEIVKIASLTKIMTAVVAIENLDDLFVEYTFDGDLLNYLASENASVAGFAKGETVIAADLLYAALFPSGGDGAMGLAELVGGSQENFVSMMNQKAAELGMNRTHFTNATGFDDEGNYSCAYDISLMFEYALNNPTFRQVISGSKSVYTTTRTAQHPNGIRLVSTVYAGFRDNGIDMGSVIGGKTGYTLDAGRCLATFAESGGDTYILITLGAAKTPQHFADAARLYSAFVYGS